MKTQTNKLSALLPWFPGFYDSSLDELVDQEIESERDETGEDYEAAMRRFDMRLAMKAITREWVAAFAEESGIAMDFEEVVSPKEYNFTTDRAFALVPAEEILRIAPAKDTPAFEGVLKRWFTGYDGFIPYRDRLVNPPSPPDAALPPGRADRTAIQLRDRFPTEDACRAYLAGLRWPDGIICPACGSKEVWVKKPPVNRCARCKHDFTVTSGTLFADTHKPLRLWFEAIWDISNQKSGASALGLQRVLGLGSYRTAWNWLHKLRRAMVRPGRDRLSGVVEVDEAFIGGARSGKRGRGAAGKSLVMVAAQAAGKKIGRIRMVRVADASAANLLPAIAQSVEPGTMIQTDGWRAYSGLKDLGYGHEVIRQTDELGENLLPRINLTVSLLKRWLLGTLQGAVRSQHLDYYLDEFTFRFNRRTSKSRGLLFYRLLQHAVVQDPVRGKNLVGGRALEYSNHIIEWPGA